MSSAYPSSRWTDPYVSMVFRTREMSQYEWKSDLLFRTREMSQCEWKCDLLFRTREMSQCE